MTHITNVRWLTKRHLYFTQLISQPALANAPTCQPELIPQCFDQITGMCVYGNAFGLMLPPVLTVLGPVRSSWAMWAALRRRKRYCERSAEFDKQKTQGALHLMNCLACLLQLGDWQFGAFSNAARMKGRGRVKLYICVRDLKHWSMPAIWPNYTGGGHWGWGFTQIQEADINQLKQHHQ